MKRSVSVLTAVLLLCCAGICSAQEETKKEPVKMSAVAENLKKTRSTRMQHSQRNPWFTQLSLIRGMQSTGDGGIVVMVADKMIKYDQDLNKVKEVTIELPELPEPMMSGGCGSGSGCGSCASKQSAEKTQE